MLDNFKLIDRLNTKLTEFKYSRNTVISIPSVHYITLIKQKNLFKCKNLCAFIEIPSKITDIITARYFLEFLKKCLLNQFGNALLWKELEMFFIVSCDTKLYEILKQDEGKLMNQTSFSLIALLGVCVIDKNTLDSFARSTWGLHFSGEHFSAINEIVTQFCDGQEAGVNPVHSS